MLLPLLLNNVLSEAGDPEPEPEVVAAPQPVGGSGKARGANKAPRSRPRRKSIRDYIDFPPDWNEVEEDALESVLAMLATLI